MARGRFIQRRGNQYAIAAILFLLASFGSACAANAATTIESIRLGIGGLYRADRLCPVELRIGDVPEDGDYRVEIDATDDAGQRIRYAATHQLKAPQSNRVVQLIQLGRAGGTIRVALLRTDGTLLTQREFAAQELAEPIADGESLVVVIGRLTGLDAVDALRANPSTRTRYQQMAGIDRLPSGDGVSLADRSQSLDVASKVVWIVGQSESSMVADSGSLRLLDDWVRGGGRLIVSLGPNAAKDLADLDFARALHLGPLNEHFELRQTAPLESFVGGVAPSTPGRGDAASEERPFQLRATRIGSLDSKIDGKIIVSVSQSDGNLPLVVEMSHGFGQVVVVTFDMNDPALVAWPGHTRLVARILALGDEPAVRGADAEARVSAWTGKGYARISEQLADALDQFPGTSPETFWYLAAAVIGFVIVIGPVDWYLVRRKPERTWATFLGSVVLAAGGAFALIHFTKTDEVLASSLTFVDVDLTAQGMQSSEQPTARVRGKTWASIYQPSDGIVDIAMSPPPFGKRAEAEPSNAVDPSAVLRLVLWNRSRAAGESLMSLFNGEQRSMTARYDWAHGRIEALSRSAWSSQFVGATWVDDCIPPEVAALAPDAFGRVVGTVRNPLEETLDQGVLFYGTFALTLGNMKPGQAIQVDGRGDWRSTEAYLTRQSFVQDRESAERYDPRSIDLARIGEILGFFDASGGKGYTGLDNLDVAAVDLTNQLRLGRAVLIGRTATGPDVALSTDVRVRPHRQTTWWRFLIRPDATLASGK
jgi:hypothetical protein